MSDALNQFKEMQKKAWSGFAVMESFTGTGAPRLVRFAGVKAGTKVLDVGCGTGVVALAAARKGARVTGIDLTPELIAHAKEHATLVGAEIDWREGDAEALPFPDGTFDTVISQFGHMFAPRPDVTVKEMLRVLKPGGTIAFATWPPELFTGKMFMLGGKYGPPPPPGVSPPWQWGDTNLVRERLGNAVKDTVFDRFSLRLPMLSPQHGRQFMEANIGPVARLVKALESEPRKLADYRKEFETLLAEYFDEGSNALRQDYLLTRASKV